MRAKGGTEQCVILGGAATQHRQVRLSYATVHPSSLGCCGAGAQWPAPSGAQLVSVTMLSTVHHLPCWRLRLWLRCGSTLVWQSHCGGYRVFSCVSTTPPAAPRCRLFAVCLSGDYTFGCAATAHCSGGGAVSCTVGRAASCVRECPSVGCNTLSTDLPHRLLRLLQLQRLRHQLRSPSNRRPHHLRRRLPHRQSCQQLHHQPHRPQRHVQLHLLRLRLRLLPRLLPRLQLRRAVGCSPSAFLATTSSAVLRLLTARAAVPSVALSAVLQAVSAPAACRQLAHQLHRLVFHHLCRRQRRQVR